MNLTSSYLQEKEYHVQKPYVFLKIFSNAPSSYYIGDFPGQIIIAKKIAYKEYDFFSEKAENMYNIGRCNHSVMDYFKEMLDDTVYEKPANWDFHIKCISNGLVLG